MCLSCCSVWRSVLEGAHGADALARSDQCVDVDTGMDAQAVEQVEHVLAGHVAAGALGIGTAAEAGHRAVEHVDAFQQARVDVRQRLAVGVVEVPGQLVARDVAADHLEQGTGLAGGAGADGVAERDLVAAHLEQLASHRGDLLRRHLAFVGAAEHAGHVTAHTDTLLAGGVHHRHEALEALGDRAVDVLLREGLAGGGEHRDFLHPGEHGRLEALHVGRQRGVGDAALLPDLGEHLGGAGHLRHPLGRDEAADLDVFETGGAQVVDQTHLVGDADRLFLVLQAVARADFDQADVLGQGNGGCLHLRFPCRAVGSVTPVGGGLDRRGEFIRPCTIHGE